MTAVPLANRWPLSNSFHFQIEPSSLLKTSARTSMPVAAVFASSVQPLMVEHWPELPAPPPPPPLARAGERASALVAAAAARATASRLAVAVVVVDFTWVSDDRGCVRCLANSQLCKGTVHHYPLVLRPATVLLPSAILRRLNATVPVDVVQPRMSAASRSVTGSSGRMAADCRG